jgi:hypothetical protein
MRPVLVLAVLTFALDSPHAVRAGLPDPARSRVGVSGNAFPCHFRFDPGGGWDVLTVSVSLRDVFDTPVPDCSTSCTLVPDALAFCSCCPVTQIGVTDTEGVVQFTWDQIGGRGEIDIVPEALSCIKLTIAGPTITFTSADLEGGCQNEPLGVGVIDMGIWVGGLQVYREASDYDCDGTVDVIDFALWAGGLGSGCGPPCP